MAIRGTLKAEHIHDEETGADYWQVSTPGPMVARCGETLARAVDTITNADYSDEEAWDLVNNEILDWQPAQAVPVVEPEQLVAMYRQKTVSKASDDLRATLREYGNELPDLLRGLGQVGFDRLQPDAWGGLNALIERLQPLDEDLWTDVETAASILQGSSLDVGMALGYCIGTMPPGLESIGDLDGWFTDVLAKTRALVRDRV